MKCKIRVESDPALPEYEAPEQPECVVCGWDRELREIDGGVLCSRCLEDYVLKQYRDRYREFIEQVSGEAGRFALWWFSGLSEREKEAAALNALRAEAAALPSQARSKFGELAVEYVKDNAGEFAEHIIKSRNREG